MSGSRLDELAESARNRGLKLVRSRVRSPGKDRFGKVGLCDRSGKPILGIDAKGPNASPEEVEDYLRNLGAKDWGASLDVSVMPRKKRGEKVERRPLPANDLEPQRQADPKPRPKPAPLRETKPKLRDARGSDAPRLAELVRELGHEISEKAVGKNLKILKKAGETPIVAVLDKKVVGFVGLHRMATIHRDSPVGRIPALIVSKDARGQKIGRLLVEAAELWLCKHGCRIVEVTSNDRLAAAHAFYRHMGYERTGIRFFKKL